ncbi:hypothetical protein FRC19_007385 [Serendipita sp. 401]|nr:hypothetical protein FRC19_007385 [Serendipita sp. 401]KAG9057296.1 hypothetical protein FS842_007654 [Serendipita sp. 407]
MAAVTSDNADNAACSNVFSMTDDLLAQRYRFCKEYGVGNWGTVWLGQDKRTGKTPEEQKKVAIKLVHRSKTQATAVKVRALWNEMKIVRPLADQCHPSVVQFHEFIISPSYALIVMEFLPKALPVPVPESKAKPWMLSLASAIEFLHSRGVVHNDIKPANILLSEGATPKFVDFGFAEQYDLTSPEAFHSALAYGTPEYLSPERAKGQVHDTRKSDVWSLGITFFEMIMGRTPFEKDKGEQFISKAELDVYWRRTYRGKWLATATEQFRKQMSKGLEALIRRMLAPNADVRMTASQVMTSPYWSGSFAAQGIAQSPVRSAASGKQAVTATKTVSHKLSMEGKHNKENTYPRSRLVRSQRRAPSLTSRANTTPDALQAPNVIANGQNTVATTSSDTKDTVVVSPRPRANEIFTLTGKRSFDGQLAIGYSADLNAPYTIKQPARCLRHIASDQFPFNERAIEGTPKTTDAQSTSEHEVRRIKSEASVNGISTSPSPHPVSNCKKTHQRTPSYNSLYLGRSGMKTIPEVRAEDTDEQTQVAEELSTDNTAEAYYHQLLANTATVEQVGKGYQSKLCTRNDVVLPKKSIAPPTKNEQPDVTQSPAAKIFLSVRESQSARPKRKIRQAASFDGFGDKATRREYVPQRPRPTSAHVTTKEFDAHLKIKEKEREPKKSVVGAVRKAFLMFLGVSEKRTKRD